MIYFDNWLAAWDMAGHGPYVWSAYAITFAVLCWLIVGPLTRARHLRNSIRAEQRRRAVATAAVEGIQKETSHASKT